jgi:hypothetical protein
MLVASNCICGVAGFEWKIEGDKGAIEIPFYLASDLISRGDQFWAVDGTTPAPKPEPTVEPKVELEEDESTGNDIDDALDASNVGTRKSTRARKSTKE